MNDWAKTGAVIATVLGCAGFLTHRQNVVQQQILDLHWQMVHIVRVYDHAAGQPWRTDRLLEDSALHGPGFNVLNGSNEVICPKN